MSDSSSSPPQVDILIVDDTPLNLTLLGRILTKQGYHVRSFSHGVPAVKSACMNPPDLILLDIMMPEVDGYTVCQQLKAAESTREVPVIFLSALNETEDKLRAFQVGGVDYITKPFQPEEVLARVVTHLKLQTLQRQLRETNQILQQRNEELQFRNEELDTFAQTVAHDLKNPLGVVLGYASVLADFYDTLTDDDRLHSAQLIAKSSTKMLEIVDELLMLARVRSSEIDFESLDTAMLVTQAIERLSIQIQAAHAQVVLPQSWPAARGYSPWIEEVWTNLISNGLKYGGQPPQLELGGEVLDTGMARFWVRDNGPGISQEDQGRLFIPFMRLEVSRSNGHGLGLSIVRRIVEKLGGKAGVESTLGEGSTFYFTLPTP